MSDPNQPSVPPGWYPDGQGGQRWWDGTQWTEHTQPPASPEPPAAPEAPATPPPPASPPPGVPGGDLPTMIAPNVASNYPQQPAVPQQPQQPQQYGAPAVQPGYGQPGQAPFGAGYSSSSGGGSGKLIAIIGGALAALILVIILVVVLFKVVLGGGPKDVAEDYLNATADGDFQKVCELVRDKDQKSLFDELDINSCGDVDDAIKNDPAVNQGDLESFQNDFKIEFEIGDVKEKDTTAEVAFTSTTKYSGDDESIKAAFKDSSEQKGTIYLVKEGGDWKVDAEKSDGAGLFSS